MFLFLFLLYMIEFTIHTSNTPAVVIAVDQLQSVKNPETSILTK